MSELTDVERRQAKAGTEGQREYDLRGVALDQLLQERNQLLSKLSAARTSLLALAEEWRKAEAVSPIGPLHGIGFSEGMCHAGKMLERRIEEVLGE